MMKVVVFVFAVLAAVVAHSAHGLDHKMLGGPPSEFKRHGIPDSSLGALFQSSATHFMRFEQTADNERLWTYEVDVVVDSDEGFQFSLMSPLLDRLEPTLRDPSGNAVDLSGHKTQSFWPVGDSATEIIGDVYTFEKPAVGTYHLTLAVSDMAEAEFLQRVQGARSRSKTSGDGILLVWNESQDEIFSKLTSYLTMRQDDNLGFQAQMYDVTANPSLVKAKGLRPTALGDAVSAAKLEVFFPNGTRVEEQMHDDGLHNDLLANDGVFGGSFVPDVCGSYLVQTVLEGTRSNGAAFVRTAEHSVRIVPRSLELTGAVDMHVDRAQHRLVVDLAVKQFQVDAGFTDLAERYRAYFELHGRNIFTGHEVPIAWSSALVAPTAGSNGAPVLRLDVDLAWLAAAAAVGPFSLKNVYVQEVNTFIPVSTMGAIDAPLSASNDVALWRAFQTANATYDGTVTEKMRFGVRPKWLHERVTARASGNATAAADANPALVLLHGYCSDSNPWKHTSHVWDDARYFEDPKQSRSHDKFAQLVVEFAEKEGLTSYGLLGHSQGGFASVHVYNYYWTGVDASQGARKLQSMGTPYQGNSGAGFWAEVLNMLVEEGCDSQEDLTRDGAQMWLSGISAEVADNMYYYVTQYDKGGPLGNGYCNMLTNAVLAKPNDGVTEVDYAHLEGAHYMGLTKGECHIQDMNWPASFLNEDRNKLMNAEAAR
ncbi:hypothetical protein PTSG_01015 [Salpingoeca rosetta]|uniref:Conditioned medium factor n=1 Tax=Salpingoeca rosetta (strain ATCC 50818 / BSB-021) TaxID=946362 RepID=F2TY53_SALR5|nr:uncharacterized protein PTSG_01015 [Salpingoeca rosetta]EGD76312.1 hypothetical protein PTSG_01015 [Salpingoeca rosetta]|eukprot:XP_004998487.1 hypothetical protein PTSG_01015 [Salpingoeca rosetta]